MRIFIIAVFSFIFAVFTVRGTKITNTTPVDSAKTGGQTILCNHYAGEDPRAHGEAIKKTGREARSDTQTVARRASYQSRLEKIREYLFPAPLHCRMRLEILVAVCWLYRLL